MAGLLAGALALSLVAPAAAQADETGPVRITITGLAPVAQEGRRLGDAGQTLLDDIGPEVLEVQMDVIGLLAHTPPLADLDGHRA